MDSHKLIVAATHLQRSQTVFVDSKARRNGGATILLDRRNLLLHDRQRFCCGDESRAAQILVN